MKTYKILKEELRLILLENRIDRNTRIEVALHKNTHPDTLNHLSNDKHPGVKKLANDRLGGL